MGEIQIKAVTTDPPPVKQGNKKQIVEGTTTKKRNKVVKGNYVAINLRKKCYAPKRKFKGKIWRKSSK